MYKNWFEQQHHALLIGLLIAVSYFILMFGNGFVSLTHPDEVFYIQSAKEMLANNSWLTPMIFDGVHFEKPFLSLALFMLAIKWFGLTAYAGRFWPSLFGIAGVGVVYWIAWMLFKRKRLAFLSGIILTSSFIYLALSRAVLTDMIFSVFATASIGFFYFAYCNRKYKQIGINLWMTFAAIAVLTKGLLGVLFPVAGVMIFLLYKKDLLFLRSRKMLWGILLFIGIAVPWHVLMYMRHGSWFLEEYFYNVHWRRILMSEHAKLDNWYFYLMLIVVGITPWIFLWIPAAYSLFSQFKKKMASRDKLFFLLAWIIGVYIFIQPAHSKLASYLFPAFPAVVIILAFVINEALEKAGNGETPKLLKVSGHLMSVLLIIIAIGGVFVAKHYIDIIVDMQPIYFSSAMFICIALLIAFFNFKKMYTPMVFIHTLVTVIFIAGTFFARGNIEPWVSCKDVSNVFKQMDQSNTPILTSKFYSRGVRYYTDRSVAVMDIFGHGFWSPHPIPYLNTDVKVVQFFKKRPVTWAILKEGNIKDLKRIIREQNQPLRMTELESIGGKYILKIERIR